MPRKVFTPEPSRRRRRSLSNSRSAPPWLERTQPPAPGPVKRTPVPDEQKATSPAPSANPPPQAIPAGHSVPKPPEVKEPRPVPSPTPKEKEPASPPPPSPPKPQVPAWILQVRKLDLLEVAAVLGLKVEDSCIRPCPRCGDEAGAEVYRNKKEWVLWRCTACEARDRGNLDLVSYALAGEKAGDLPVEQKLLLRQWFVDQGWCHVGADEPV